MISITLKPAFYEAEFPLRADVGRSILDCELHVCGPPYRVVEYLGKVLESRVFVPSRVCYQTGGLYIEAAAFRWAQCVSYNHLYLRDGVECQVPSLVELFFVCAFSLPRFQGLSSCCSQA